MRHWFGEKLWNTLLWRNDSWTNNQKNNCLFFQLQKNWKKFKQIFVKSSTGLNYDEKYFPFMVLHGKAIEYCNENNNILDGLHISNYKQLYMKHYWRQLFQVFKLF